METYTSSLESADATAAQRAIAEAIMVNFMLSRWLGGLRCLICVLVLLVVFA